MGDAIVIAVLGILVTTILRFTLKNRKNGGACKGCSGNCALCSHNGRHR